jgi:altronate hydrolase
MNDLGGVMALNLQNFRWRGYGRQDGSKGIRNKLLIVYTVKCSSFVAKKIAAKLDDDHVDVVGFDGCCDNDYAVRLLLSLARHPNIGAVLAVGLGCEYVQPQLLAKKAAECGGSDYTSGLAGNVLVGRFYAGTGP